MAESGEKRIPTQAGGRQERQKRPGGEALSRAIEVCNKTKRRGDAVSKAHRTPPVASSGLRIKEKEIAAQENGEACRTWKSVRGRRVHKVRLGGEKEAGEKKRCMRSTGKRRDFGGQKKRSGR